MIWTQCAEQWIYIKAFAAPLFIVHPTVYAGFACAKITTKAYKVLRSVERRKKHCLIWNISEIRTVCVASCLWKINLVREESNYKENHSVKTCFLRSSIQSLLQTRISLLCRSNKGPLGGSGARDEDRLKLVRRKLWKQGGFDLLSSFVFIERDLACHGIACLPLCAYSCQVANNSSRLAPSRRGTPVMHFNQTGCAY